MFEIFKTFMQRLIFINNNGTGLQSATIFSKLSTLQVYVKAYDDRLVSKI